MKRLAFAALFAAVLSGCAPGAFERRAGVPLTTGEVYTLEMNPTGQPVPPLEFRVGGVSQPAASGGRPGAYIVGPYVITYNPEVSRVEWFNTVANGDVLTLVSLSFRDTNVFSVILKRAGLNYVASCEFAGWSFSDSSFQGVLYNRGADGTSPAFRAGTCLLARSKR
jgi:hypothetical protein